MQLRRGWLSAGWIGLGSPLAKPEELALTQRSVDYDHLRLAGLYGQNGVCDCGAASASARHPDHVREAQLGGAPTLRPGRWPRCGLRRTKSTRRRRPWSGPHRRRPARWPGKRGRARWRRRSCPTSRTWTLRRRPGVPAAQLLSLATSGTVSGGRLPAALLVRGNVYAIRVPGQRAVLHLQSRTHRSQSSEHGVGSKPRTHAIACASPSAASDQRRCASTTDSSSCSSRTV